MNNEYDTFWMTSAFLKIKLTFKKNCEICFMLVYYIFFIN